MCCIVYGLELGVGFAVEGGYAKDVYCWVNLGSLCWRGGQYHNGRRHLSTVLKIFVAFCFFDDSSMSHADSWGAHSGTRSGSSLCG